MKKRLLGLALVSALVVSLVGCGGKKTVDTSNQAMEPDAYADSLKKNVEVYRDLVTLAEYRNVEVEVDKSVLEVSDEDLEEYINDVLSDYGEDKDITSGGVTQKGDTIKLDYQGLLDGEPFSGGTATEVTYTIGSGKFIEDLDNGLVGLSANVEYRIPCKFPDNYDEKLAGKDTIFVVTISNITRTEVPKLTDEFITTNKEKLGVESGNVADFKAEVKEFLKSQAESKYNNTKFSSLIAKICDASEVKSYPEKEKEKLKETLKTNINQEYTSYESYYKASGIESFNDYLKQVYGVENDEEYEKYLNENVESYLKEKMIISIIAVDNGITISGDDINKIGEEYAEYYGYDNYQAIIDQYGKEMNCELGYELVYEKVADIIIENSVEIEK